MILLIGFYSDPDADRRGELMECLRRNVSNHGIDEVHVFIEDATDPEAILPTRANGQKSKLILIPLGRRVTFRFVFDYANRNLKGRTVMIANADICFDETLGRLNGHDLTGKLLCLSRWDVRADGSTVFFEHPSSQDAWIFQAPIPEINCDFYLGLPACDNRLAWEAEQAGLEISNPARTLHANHLHLTATRRYHEGQRLLGQVKSISATYLETPYPSPLGAPPSVACAAIAFSETMGYTIATLDPGASSHNNDHRPFELIPDVLRGRRFTQVVSGGVSEVEIEFLSAGKLYVLVGTDWGGHEPATEWLARTGYKEDLCLARTSRDNAFEIWSLVAAAGERFVIPTQVMLVSDHLVKRESLQNKSQAVARSPAQDSIFALTSLSPNLENATHISRCIDSWKRAGLRVVSFNHPTEIPELEKHFTIEFVPVAETSIDTFGAPYMPVNALLDWAGQNNGPVLLINSDIELQMESWELKRLRWMAEHGLCYFIRFNHDGEHSRATREPDGIDAFLFHGRDANLFAKSFMSLGKPCWDYWVPHTFAAHNRPIYSVEFPVAFHLRHQNRWSWEDWHRCALEFERVSGEPDRNKSIQACLARARRLRQDFDHQRISVAHKPPRIREWVEHTFAYPGVKTFIELGSHRGADTEWMATIPGVSLYAVEPDPRNEQPARANVTVEHAAVADFNGQASLILSKEGYGQEWTYSSSIKQPFNHLQRYPVTFGESVAVKTTTLDSLCERHGLGVVDFIWADIQGAEGEMIRGGRAALARTRYLFIEYSDDEMYRDQSSLNEILAMLPTLRVVDLWPDDVLLENQALK
jgi:FkbM family methyltransferase